MWAGVLLGRAARAPRGLRVAAGVAFAVGGLLLLGATTTAGLLLVAVAVAVGAAAVLLVEAFAGAAAALLVASTPMLAPMASAWVSDNTFPLLLASTAAAGGGVLTVTVLRVSVSGSQWKMMLPPFGSGCTRRPSSPGNCCVWEKRQIGRLRL
jgi:hypothetical protein